MSGALGTRLEERRARTPGDAARTARLLAPLPPAPAGDLPELDVSRARPSRFIALADRVFSAWPSAPVLAVDLVVVTAAVAATGVSVAGSIGWALSCLLAFLVVGVYQQRSPLEVQGFAWYAARIVTPVMAVVLADLALGSHSGPEVEEGFRRGAAIALSLLALRAVVRAVLIAARGAGYGLRPTLILGNTVGAEMISDKLASFPEAGLVPAGVLRLATPDRPVHTSRTIEPLDLPAVIGRYGIEHVMLVPEGHDDASITACLEACAGCDVDFSMLPPLADLYLRPEHPVQLGGVPLVVLGRMTRQRRSLPGKRLFDVVLASVLLLVLAPVMAITALAVWLGDRGPVLYRQRRVGRDGIVFELLKFRSMVVDAERLAIDLRDRNVTDGLLFKVERDPRVTAVGRLIRRLSVDELPQLWNVLRGDMSLVGPRPLAVDPDDFGPMDGKRHVVRPGITGYWQTVGGNGLTYQEMVKLDLAYIQNWSLWLDARLLIATLPALVHRRGPC